MKKLRKLTNNILNLRAARVLGLRAYARLLLECVRQAAAIARAGDLRPLDRSMGGATEIYHFGGRRFHFDCAFADATIHDGSYAFGIVREILIRNCYLRYLPDDTLRNLDTVVDLGANRGMFSILSAAFAARVLSVEANPEFRPVIEHNARRNGFRHITVDTAFVGAGGKLGSGGYEEQDLPTLLSRHGIQSVDLLKVDIEGSEFALFRQAEWVRHVRRLCMEVHREHGQAGDIVRCLHAHGFSMAFADGDLQRVGREAAFEYLYAWQ